MPALVISWGLHFIIGPPCARNKTLGFSPVSLSRVNLILSSARRTLDRGKSLPFLQDKRGSQPWFCHLFILWLQGGYWTPKKLFPDSNTFYSIVVAIRRGRTKSTKHCLWYMVGCQGMQVLSSSTTRSLANSHSHMGKNVKNVWGEYTVEKCWWFHVRNSNPCLLFLFLNRLAYLFAR